MKRALSCLAVLLLLVGTCSAPQLRAVTSTPVEVPVHDVTTPDAGDGSEWRLPKLDLVTAKEHRLYKRAQRKLERWRKRLERKDGRLTVGGIVMIVGGSLTLIGLVFYIPTTIQIERNNRENGGCANIFLLPVLIISGIIAGAGLITLLVGLILHLTARAVGVSPPDRTPGEEPAGPERRDG